MIGADARHPAVNESLKRIRRSLQESPQALPGLHCIECPWGKMGSSNMVTDIPQQSLPAEKMQMLRILIKRMLTETDPERLRMFTEQIRDRKSTRLNSSHS